MTTIYLKMLYSCLLHPDSILEDEQRTSVGELIDSHYSKNKPSTLPAKILKIKHHHRIRGFKLTNFTSLGEYLHVG
jgi:hypothetical protein